MQNTAFLLKFFETDSFPAVCPQQRNFVTYGSVRDRIHFHHHLIHADIAAHRCPFSADQDLSFSESRRL